MYLCNRSSHKHKHRTSWYSFILWYLSYRGSDKDSYLLSNLLSTSSSALQKNSPTFPPSRKRTSSGHKSVLPTPNIDLAEKKCRESGTEWESWVFVDKPPPFICPLRPRIWSWGYLRLYLRRNTFISTVSLTVLHHVVKNKYVEVTCYPKVDTTGFNERSHQ